MKRVFVIAILSAVLVTSCDLLNICIRGNGKLVTEYHDVSGYNFIVNSTAIDVTVVEADTFGLIMMIDENLADNIVISVTAGTLEIRQNPIKNCISHTISPSIIVSAPSIAGLRLSGTGNFTVPALSGNDVSVMLSGTGNIAIVSIKSSTLEITISGTGDLSVTEILCDEAGITLSGTGNLNAAGAVSHGLFSITGSGDSYTPGLVLQTAAITVYGSGHVHTHITGSLNAIIGGSGNIYLKGNPTVHSNISGSGRIIYNK